MAFQRQSGTDIEAALNYVETEVFNTREDRPDAPNVIVILTDAKMWDNGMQISSLLLVI